MLSQIRSVTVSYALRCPSVSMLRPQCRKVESIQFKPERRSEHDTKEDIVSSEKEAIGQFPLAKSSSRSKFLSFRVVGVAGRDLGRLACKEVERRKPAIEVVRDVSGFSHKSASLYIPL